MQATAKMRKLARTLSGNPKGSPRTQAAYVRARAYVTAVTESKKKATVKVSGTTMTARYYEARIPTVGTTVEVEIVGARVIVLGALA